MAAEPRRRELIDDLDALLMSLPPDIIAAVHGLENRSDLIEVVLDLGRRPEARFPDSEVVLLEREVSEADINYVVDHIGSFGDDNRAGIERTLHRISAIRNRTGKIVGLTLRIGRAVYGTIEIIDDFVETGKSILIMGRPGIGKTTMLREAARVLADDLGKRVVVVDTSNEIAGDGDIPHPAIGKARRMQVRTPSLQHEVMIEAVENHMPQVIVIDEIGTELEAQAARTIAERGVQLIGTAHGNNLDNLMLNPTLSDLIGGIQSVTLGDEEARRRRSQKSVLERKAPPTFDVVIEIQDRDRVMVHSDVADTVDAMLRGDPIAPELRWRDEEGVHRSQARPRPSPREQLGNERFAGLVGSGQGWRTEPGWRGESSYRSGGFRETDRTGFRPGYRPGASGGWRTRPGSAREGRDAGRDGGSRDAGRDAGRDGGSRDAGGRGGDYRETRGGNREGASRGPDAGPGQGSYRDDPRDSRDPRDARVMPGERFAVPPGGTSSPGSAVLPRGVTPADLPFVAGELADRGPLERGAVPVPEPRARDAREVERQRAWREQAAKALDQMKVEEGQAPVNADAVAAAVAGAAAAEGLDDEDDDVLSSDASLLRVEGAGILPTIRVLPHGISRKRLEQAIRELQLPVIIAHDVDDAEVVMTLKSEYRQKTPTLREAEDRSLPIYVLKSNTMLQIQASLTSVFALEVDPREAALRETEDAIDLVLSRSEPVELSPQNAFIRRLQHQMAERANVVSRSRGREPYRRVRLYPDPARSAWR